MLRNHFRNSFIILSDDNRFLIYFSAVIKISKGTIMKIYFMSLLAHNIGSNHRPKRGLDTVDAIFIIDSFQIGGQ